jgi:hypothetical protein
VVVLAWFTIGSNTPTTATCQDNNGKSYTQPAASPSTYFNGAQCFAFYRICDGTEGTTVTITFANAADASIIWIAEVSSPTGTVFFDHSANGTGTGTPTNTPTIPVTGTDDFVCAGLADTINSVDAPWTAGTGFTPGFGYGYRLSGVNADQTVVWTGSVGEDYTAVGMSFRSTAPVVTPDLQAASLM